MVINPETVSQSDPRWRRACALLKLLALEPRRQRWEPSTSAHFVFGKKTPLEFIANADEYLARPEYWREGRRQLGDQYMYTVHFGVACTITGTIPVDAQEQLEEFRRAVNDAIQGPLTAAARRRWTYEQRWREVRAPKSDPERQMYLALQILAANEADRLYDAARAVVLRARGANDDQHERILDYLADGGGNQPSLSTAARDARPTAPEIDATAVMGRWLDRVRRALSAVEDSPARFHTSYQSRSGEARPYHAHTGQPVQLVGVAIAPDLEFDEEALPYLRGRFQDGMELHCATEEIVSDDLRILELLDAVNAGFAVARALGYVGPYDLYANGTAGQMRLFAEHVEQFKHGLDWQVNPKTVFQCSLREAESPGDDGNRTAPPPAP